jgi:hypothetical protein
MGQVGLTEMPFVALKAMGTGYQASTLSPHRQPPRSGNCPPGPPLQLRLREGPGGENGLVPPISCPQASPFSMGWRLLGARPWAI